MSDSEPDKLTATMWGLKAQVDQLTEEMQAPETSEARREEIKAYCRQLYVTLQSYLAE